MNGPLPTPWLIWPIALPLLGAVAAFVWPRRAVRSGLLTAGLLVPAVVAVVTQLTRHGELVHEAGGWAAPLGIALRADGLAVVMLLMVTAVGLAVSVYATGYFGVPTSSLKPAVSRGRGEDEGGHERAGFWTLWLFLWAALNALFLSRDLFNLYVTLELLGLAAVALVALAGAPVAVAAAMRYLLVSLVGSLAFLLGVALVYAAHGTLDLPQLGQRMAAGPGAAAALGLMTAGLLMKAALFPLHFWLPPAHANAPAPVSALLSALVVKAAFYLVVRLWFEVFAPATTRATHELLGALGAAAVLWGSWQALHQPRLKLVIAYSTVAQLGYLFLLFPLAGAAGGGFTAWAGVALFALAHAGAKTVLFLSAGSLMRAAGHDRLADLAPAARARPVTMFAFALASVSLIGLPPSGGFLAKWMLLNGALAAGQWWWVAVMAAGTLLAAAYLLRVLALPFAPATDAPAGPPLPRALEWPALALALATIGLGFAASPLVAWLRIGAPVGGPVLLGGAP